MLSVIATVASEVLINVGSHGGFITSITTFPLTLGLGDMLNVKGSQGAFGSCTLAYT